MDPCEPPGERLRAWRDGLELALLVAPPGHSAAVGPSIVQDVLRRDRRPGPTPGPEQVAPTVSALLVALAVVCDRWRAADPTADPEGIIQALLQEADGEEDADLWLQGL